VAVLGQFEIEVAAQHGGCKAGMLLKMLARERPTAVDHLIELRVVR